jgi:leader peptidase (prepilin peptidase)/N-methyltransferase
MVASVALAWGLLIGSFLNVLAYRLPRGESLAVPASRCPGCETPIRPYDNVPVLSWLLLRGKCRACGIAISARYPAVEALTAALFAAVALVHGPSAATALGIVLVALLVPIALIDLDLRIIPNKLTGAGAIAAVILTAALEPGQLPERLAAGAALAFAFSLPAFIGGGMGMGDAKLVGVLGLFLGWHALIAVGVGLITGTVVGVAVIARVGMARGRKTTVPFGPFLAFGGIVALLAGGPLAELYLSAL